MLFRYYPPSSKPLYISRQKPINQTHTLQFSLSSSIFPEIFSRKIPQNFLGSQTLPPWTNPPFSLPPSPPPPPPPFPSPHLRSSPFRYSPSIPKFLLFRVILCQTAGSKNLHLKKILHFPVKLKRVFRLCRTARRRGTAAGPRRRRVRPRWRSSRRGSTGCGSSKRWSLRTDERALRKRAFGVFPSAFLIVRCLEI